MLRARLAGKRTDEVLEDALTAIVLSRLSYLPGERAWSLLFRAIERLPTLPRLCASTPDELSRLRCASSGVSFSPRLWPWFRAEVGDGRIQPDALVQVGDALLVIEAKRAWCGDSQDLRQLRAELGAVRAREGDHRRLVVVMIEPPSSVEGWFDALGAPLLALRWTDLRGAVEELLARVDLAPHERAILEDLADGLDLAGARAVRPMRDIELDSTLGAVPSGFSEVK